MDAESDTAGRRRWIVVSLDGLAPLALGPYGSSWNTTPTLDRMAASGVTWDRVVVPSDDTIQTLRRCWGDAPGGWLRDLRRQGRAELIVGARPGRAEQARALIALADRCRFDCCSHVELDLREQPADELHQSGFGQLAAELLDRLMQDDVAEQPWSLIWLHSDLLVRHWDAPRWLFPVDIEEDHDEDSESHAGAAGTGPVLGRASGQRGAGPPPLVASVAPPDCRITAADHPDWITAWMQTYGCQLRLIDHWLGVIMDQIAAWSAGGQRREGSDAIGLVVLGTSGFSLGQSGWIGHRAGPVRSPQIHVPAIVHWPGGAPLRHGPVTGLPEVLAPLARAVEWDASVGPPWPSPQCWAEQQLPGMLPIDPTTAGDDQAGEQRDDQHWSTVGLLQPRLLTESSRAELAVTTPNWFFVRDLDRSEHLFLKPDDAGDVNDIADRCPGVIEALRSSADAEDR